MNDSIPPPAPMEDEWMPDPHGSSPLAAFGAATLIITLVLLAAVVLSGVLTGSA